MKQIQPMTSEISAFYDPAKKPDYPLCMYTTKQPLALSAMPLSNYNSGATSIESSFKGALFSLLCRSHNICSVVNIINFLRRFVYC